MLLNYPPVTVSAIRAKSCFISSNGSKRPLAYHQLTRPCCKETSFKGRTTVRLFSCEDDGGCCGDYGSQYCCTVPNSSLAVGLGVGLTVFVIVLLVIIAVTVCCYVNIHYHKMGQEIYCAGRCRCKVRDATQPVRPFSSSQVNLSTVESTFDTEVYEPRSQPYPDPCVFRTTVAPQFQNRPAIEDDSPPSYTEVVGNPEVFVNTRSFP